MKRILDFLVAFLGIALGWPIMLVVAVLIAWRLGSPILFVQQRPGLQGKPFNLYKFRTMKLSSSISHTQIDQTVETDAARMTTLGKVLRETSLDELPTLFNVLLGHMSLVGPRPLLMEYLPLYNTTQKRRHDVKPGITGWAQINGRNAVSWERKFELDVWYVENRSVALDCKIIAKTFAKVFKREGIALANHATTTKFEGSASGTAQSADDMPATGDRTS